MRGADLLLAHLAVLSDPDQDPEPVDRPSARERLDAELGPEFAERLVGALGLPHASS